MHAALSAINFVPAPPSGLFVSLMLLTSGPAPFLCSSFIITPEAPGIGYGCVCVCAWPRAIVLPGIKWRQPTILYGREDAAD